MIIEALDLTGIGRGRARQRGLSRAAAHGQTGLDLTGTARERQRRRVEKKAGLEVEMAGVSVCGGESG